MCLSGTPSAMLSDTIDIALLERHEPHTRIAGLVLDETGAVPTLFASPADLSQFHHVAGAVPMLFARPADLSRFHHV